MKGHSTEIQNLTKFLQLIAKLKLEHTNDFLKHRD